MVITLTVYHHHFGSRYTAYRPTKTILDTSVHIPGVKALPSLIQWNKSLKRSGKNKYNTRTVSNKPYGNPFTTVIQLCIVALLVLIGSGIIMNMMNVPLLQIKYVLTTSFIAEVYCPCMLLSAWFCSLEGGCILAVLTTLIGQRDIGLKFDKGGWGWEGGSTYLYTYRNFWFRNTFNNSNADAL